MFHSTALAIGAGVVAVGAAAGSAAISMSAADRAKKAQGAAAGAFKKQQRKAVSEYELGQKKVSKMIQGVQAPEYNLEDQEVVTQKVRWVGKGKNKRKVVDKVVTKKPGMISQAGKISDYYRQQLETFQPGAAQQRQQAQTQIGQAMDVVSSYLRGDIPQDVKDQITRNVAESAGAGFNPATAGRTGGFQAAQGQLARNLGLTSLDIQGRGLAAMPSVQGTAMNWQQLARAFTAEPLDVGRLQLGYQTAQAEVGLKKAQMTSDMFGNLYNAQSGLATQIYGANKENIAASYAAQQAVGQGVSDIGQATSGALFSGAQISGAQQGLNIGSNPYTGSGGGSNPYYGGMGSGGGFAGGFNYEQAYGKATPAGMGGQPKGFGNFDYGSGTGA
jgi:hypothetical protein